MSNLTEPEKKILEAAKTVFQRDGYSGARMQQIADEAGISKASLHYYFRSKENLFDKIFEETISAFLPLTLTWDNDSEDWEYKLRSFIRQFFSFLKTNSLLFIIGEINRNPDLLARKKKNGKKKENTFISYFQRMQEKHHIKKTDPKVLYIMMHSLCSYPLINSELFKMTVNANDKEFDELMSKYPDFVADFIIAALKIEKKK